ncbi:MAG: DUF3786 domain-containing protein, partial [Thermodesulfobacteriota bacterium]
LEIYKLLPQSNCRRCLLPSCLAFAAAVVAGQRKLADCPEIDQGLLAAHGGGVGAKETAEPNQAAFIAKMEGQVAGLDLAAVARQRGGRFEKGKIIINSLGKDFVVDQQGAITSPCHIIPWVVAPILSYITHATHQEITGSWISFRELKGGIDWQGLFQRRCEQPLQALADENPDFLSDLIDLFMGRGVDWYQADLAVVLHPLPHIPLLICYQAADDDLLDSDLSILFDACCAKNLHIKSIYTLCAGLVQMFVKIGEQHHL